MRQILASTCRCKSALRYLDSEGSYFFDGDAITGGLLSQGSSDITAIYSGPTVYASWDHDWLLQSEVDWSTDYPCVGTLTDPVRTCHAWGVLLPEVHGNLRWHFALMAVFLQAQVYKFGIVPKYEDKDFACHPDPVLCPNGTVTRHVATSVQKCAGHLSPFNPSWEASAFTIAPDLINDSGDVAKLFNGLFQGIVGVGKSAISTDLALAANGWYAVKPLFGDCVPGP